jgi:hypothetical protein
MNKAAVREKAAEMAARRKQTDEQAQRWQRAKDLPERKRRCEFAREVSAYVLALGLTKDLRASVEFHMLRYMAATNGADQLENCANWLMGIYVSEALSPEEEYPRVIGLDAKHKIKRRLADRAAVAWSDMSLAHHETGIRLMDREGGGPDESVTGGWRCARVRAFFIQDLVEVGRIATQLIKGKTNPHDAYIRAAQQYISALRAEIKQAAEEKRIHLRAYTAPVIDTDLPKKKGASKVAPVAATKYQRKVQKLAGKFLSALNELTAQAVEDGADLESIAAILDDQGLTEHARLVRGKAAEVSTRESEQDSEDVGDALPSRILNNTVRVDENSDHRGLHLVESEESQNPEQNSEKGQILLRCTPDQVATPLNTPAPVPRHSCPSPDVPPEEIDERFAMLCEWNDVDERDSETKVEMGQRARRELCEVCRSAEVAT